VGADGGNSTVRQLAGIEMEGNDTTYRWVRIDAKMKTNIPDPKVSFAMIESKTHGSILWVKLDRDAYRIGFALTPTLQAKYPEGITAEQAIAEAKEALHPFELEIERLDWWTQYKYIRPQHRTTQPNIS
jgi:phenol 2-monooxygenase (NADPH)